MVFGVLILTVGFILMMYYQLMFLSHCESFEKKIIEASNSLISINTFFSGILLAYLTSKYLQLRQERLSKESTIEELTQKVHKFRRITHSLLVSSIFPDRIRTILSGKYKDLTHFEVCKIREVGGNPSELSKEFAQDPKAGGLAQLYLELKSFESGEGFDYTVLSEYESPKGYSTSVLQSWHNYDCGNGLFYYFDYQFSDYKESLDFHIYKDHKEAIEESALKIDKEKYKGMKFGPELISKIGSHFYEEILPKLLRLQRKVEGSAPQFLKMITVFVLSNLLLGVGCPVFFTLFNFPVEFLVFTNSLSLTMLLCSIVFYYPILNSEIKIYK